MKKDNYTFVRFGTMDLVTQQGYSNNPETFHAPPTNRGIYAFPIKVIDLFLIGGGYDGLTSDQKKKIRKEFRCSPKDNVWHHLDKDLKNNEIIARHGAWIKTTIEYWQKAFIKESINYRYLHYDENKKIKSINEPFRTNFGIATKYRFEVFFDQKI